jgi:hypothetical protein
MDGIKQECQKFYDLLASSGPGGQGHTIELIMRTLDQDGMEATQNCVANNNNNTSGSGSGSSSNNNNSHNDNNNRDGNCETSNSHSALMATIEGMTGSTLTMTSAEEEQLAASTMELHPNIVLHSLGINTTTTTEEESTSNNSSPNQNNGSGDNNNGSSNGEQNGGRDRPHVCQVCSASYKTRTHLRRHMFVHLNNRPYPCTECGKGFNR